MNKPPTCADRVNDAWKNTRSEIAAILNPEEADHDTLTALGFDDPDDVSFAEYGLSFDYVPAGTFEDQPAGYFRYQLSWGGPSSELRFYTDPELKLYRAEYWFLDWFDGASINVTRDEIAEAVLEWFMDIGAVESALKSAENN